MVLRLWRVARAGLLLLSLMVADASRVGATPPTLRILTYDSLAAPEGWLTTLIPEWRRRCGVEPRVRSVGDSGLLLAEYRRLRTSPDRLAHLIVGLDQDQWSAIAPDVDASVESIVAQTPLHPIWRSAQLGNRRPRGVIPIDWGALAFVYRPEGLAKLGVSPPQSWQALLTPQLRGQVTAPDPRTSTPGLVLVRWLRARFGPKWGEQWRAFRPQLRLLTAGWDQSYGAFRRGETAITWSYVTSAAAGEPPGVNVLALDAPFPLQLEGATWLRSATGLPPDSGRCVTGVLLSHAAQSAIPRTQWMFPARSGVALPETFGSLMQRYLAHPRDQLLLAPLEAETAAGEAIWLQEWRAAHEARVP